MASIDSESTIIIIIYLSPHSIYKPRSKQLSASGSSKASSSFRSYAFDTQILCNYDSCLLSNSYRSVICISSYISWCDTEIWGEKGSNMYHKNSRIITGDLQVLHTIYIQPFINNPALLAWLHSTGSALKIRWSEWRVNKK